MTIYNPTANESNSWTTPHYGYSDDEAFTTCVPAKNSSVSGIWKTFQISESGTVNKVEIGIQAKESADNSYCSVTVQVSWDGGTSWSTDTIIISTTNLTTTSESTTFWLDVTSATSWDTTKLNDTNFKVRVYGKKGNSSTSYTISMDVIFARITMTRETTQYSVSRLKKTQVLSPTSATRLKKLGVEKTTASGAHLITTAWLSGYNYRARINIAGSSDGAQTDYPIKLSIVQGSGTNSGSTVYLNGHALNWPYDVRFTDSTGQGLLDLWREESDGTDGTWWVEVGSIPASPSTTDIFIYYGKNSGSDASDGIATFLLFDDFPGADYDHDKWLNAVGEEVGVSVSGGALTLTGPGGGSWYKFGSKTAAFGQGHTLEYRVTAMSNNIHIQGWNNPGFCSPASSKGVFFYNYNDRAYNNDGTTQTYTALANTRATGIFKIKYRSTSSYYEVPAGTNTTYATNMPSGDIHIAWWETSTNTTTIDWVRVRKDTANEPTPSAFAEAFGGATTYDVTKYSNARLKKLGAEVTRYSTARLKRLAVELTVNSSARLRLTTGLSKASVARLKKLGAEVNKTSDARLKKLANEMSKLSNARLKKTTDITKYSNGRLKKLGNDRTIDSIARLKKLGVTLSKTSDARLQITTGTQTITKYSNTRLKKLANELIKYSNARLRNAGITQTKYSDTRLKKLGNDRTIYSNSRLKKLGVTLTKDSIARLRLTNTTSKQSVARLKKLAAELTTSSNARILRTWTNTKNTDARLRRTGIELSMVSSARVRVTTILNKASDARLQTSFIWRDSLSLLGEKGLSSVGGETEPSSLLGDLTITGIAGEIESVSLGGGKA